MKLEIILSLGVSLFIFGFATVLFGDVIGYGLASKSMVFPTIICFFGFFGLMKEEKEE